MEPDIGSESRFLPTLPEFDASLRGFPSEYCHDVWYEEIRMVWLLNGEKILKITLLVLTEFTNVTDGWTLHDGIGRTLHSITRQKLPLQQ